MAPLALTGSSGLYYPRSVVTDPTDEMDAPVDSVASPKLPDGSQRRRHDASEHMAAIDATLKKEFDASRRVLSFGQFLDLFAAHPARYGRDASQYVHDMFVHYGTEKVVRPWGRPTRFRLFDAPWAESDPEAEEPRLVGQEHVQMGLFRILSNFAREGASNRLTLMHGPNGSAKSTAAACVHRALEVYSDTEEGALYRFHWIFPTRRTSKGAIGFGGGRPAEELETYAHLEDTQIDARLVIELRDHPLFLLPQRERRELIDKLWGDAVKDRRPSRWLYDGELCHKNKQIFDALLKDYNGSLVEVLRHVQVERYYISRRYRVGAVTVGPEMTVDAGERQVTADRSLASLPTSLQATTLFEAHGQLIEASGGVVEFSDLLKRPLDAFRYLQTTLETGSVSLSQQMVFTNMVAIGSANEVHMNAFREHPEYASFRGRLELIRVPYLRHVADERRIYDDMVVPQLRKHVAPHTTTLAAEFAVLTRLMRPDPEGYPKKLTEIVEGLTVVEKMDLYATGETPERLRSEQRKVLRSNCDLLFRETESAIAYEGLVGVSPRTMRTVILDASQDEDYRCVSPFALMRQLDALCQRTAEFEWLKLKPLSGHYHDHEHFRAVIRERLMDRIERDMRTASGLVEEQQYEELFRRYINHVSAFVKREKLRNSVTGRDEDPDESLMGEVEELLGVSQDDKNHRDGIISNIAAWAIDNPGLGPDIEAIFPDQIQQLKTSAFAKLRKPLSELLRGLVARLDEGGLSGLSRNEKQEIEDMLERLRDLGYDENSAADAASSLLRDRYLAPSE